MQVTMVNVQRLLKQIGCVGDHERKGNDWDRVYIHVPDPDGGAPLSLGRVMFYRGAYSHVKWYVEPSEQLFNWHRYYFNWHRNIKGHELISEEEWPDFVKQATARARDKWQARKAERAALPTHNANGKKIKRRAIAPPNPCRAAIKMENDHDVEQ